jgi:hypothetical protein
MRATEFLTERKFASDIQQQVSAAQSALLSLKPIIVDKGLHKFDIERILNTQRILDALGIVFEYTSDSRDTDFSEVGLAGGEYNPQSDIITIYYTDDFDSIMDDGYDYDAFVMKATETIAHELTHRRQFKDREQNYNPTDGLENREYLAHPDEIMAFANQVATELLNITGYSPSDIIKGLNNPSNKDKHLSTPLMRYLDEFEPNSAERKKFLKYLVMFLSNKEQE